MQLTSCLFLLFVLLMRLLWVSIRVTHVGISTGPLLEGEGPRPGGTPKYLTYFSLVESQHLAE